MNIETIISIARRFATARTRLTAIVDRIRAAQQSALDRDRAELRAAVNKANETQAELAAGIAEAPELFVKPRTVNVNGIRLGMTTKKGTIVFEDAEAVVDAIKSKFPTFADTAINVKETPNKEVLANWNDEQLAKIGCQRLPDDPYAVLIKPTDSAVDKLVNALLENVDASATKELVA